MYNEKNFKMISTMIVLILFLLKSNIIKERELSDSLLSTVAGGDKGSKKEIENKTTNVYY